MRWLSRVAWRERKARDDARANKPQDWFVGLHIVGCWFWFVSFSACYLVCLFFYVVVIAGLANKLTCPHLLYKPQRGHSHRYREWCLHLGAEISEIQIPSKRRHKRCGTRGDKCPHIFQFLRMRACASLDPWIMQGWVRWWETCAKRRKSRLVRTGYWRIRASWDRKGNP